MMTSTHILRSLVLATLLTPAVALAYMSPEEVLSTDQNARFYNFLPPSPRHTEQIQAEQQASHAAWRESTQQQYFAAQGAQSSDSMHDAAPSNQDALLQQIVNQLNQNQNQQATTKSDEDQRLLERVRQQQTDAQIQEAAQRLIASQESLHSGAPLTQSGPATVISLVGLAGAAVWTFMRARRMETR